MDLLEGLNTRQVEAVAHNFGPLLVVAGAGTGKTRIITRRIARLISEGHAKPDEILALTFTDKAAREMEERVDVLLPYGQFGVNITTFNAFGDDVLRTYGLEAGLQLGLRLINRTQQVLLLRENFDELKLDYFASLGNPSGLFGAWLNYFSSLRNELVTPEKYKEFANGAIRAAETSAEKLEAKKHAELAGVYEAYTNLKARLGYIDYDDQVYETLRLLEKRPNITGQLKERYKFVMVDEFQDTNQVQNGLLELLAAPSGNIMVVGDDDQSIYKFRGAAVSNILAFSERFKDVKQIVLTENYRSTAEILEAAYRLIQNNNPDRLEAKYGIDKHLTGEITGEVPEFLTASNFDAEAQAVAEGVAKRLAGGQDPTEIAILVRARKQFVPISNALKTAGVPFAISATQKLYERPEIEKLLYLIQCIVDPGASSSLYHVLESDLFGVPIAQLAEAAHQARRTNTTLESHLDGASFDADHAYHRYVSQIADWRDFSKTHSAAETIYEVIVSSGWKDRLELAAETNPDVGYIFRNLERFLQGVRDFQQISNDRSLAGYVQGLGDLKELAETDAYIEPDLSPGEVRLMTIHQAKGLEFETVFIFDLNKTAFPGARRPSPLSVPDDLLDKEVLPEGDWHLQEERRLMYVAVTRAKRELIMSFSPDHGTKLVRKPSPFVAEVMGHEPELLHGEAGTGSGLLDRFASAEPVVGDLKAKFFDDEGWLSLTPHQIDDYDTCPYNFRYKYLLEVPEPPSDAAMYGTVIHKVINQYYLMRAAGEVKLDLLNALIDKLWVNEGFLSAEHERSRKDLAKRTIANFVERENSSDLSLVATEEPFEIEIPEAKVRVRGRIDAVMKAAGGTVQIRDFKTADVEDDDKAISKAKSSLQLAIYALAWQELGRGTPDQVVLDFVNTGKVGEAVKTQKQLEAVRNKISAVAEGIRAGRYPRGNCQFCSHRPLEADLAVTSGALEAEL